MWDEDTSVAELRETLDMQMKLRDMQTTLNSSLRFLDSVKDQLKETQTSDTIADKPVPFTIPPIKFPEAVISYAIEPKSRGDEEKISTALHGCRRKTRRSATTAMGRRRSCCSPARASRTSRSPSPS